MPTMVWVPGRASSCADPCDGEDGSVGDESPHAAMPAANATNASALSVVVI